MHIISWKKIADFIVEYPNSESSLRSWYKLIKNENYSNLSDLKMVFRSADQVGKYTVFNINGNHFRLITVIHYNRKKVFVRNILTHSEYDKGKWKVK
ncbi:MAG: type II toxin-antitoxin system HigB family toxin [Leptospiraceae bacterium]|nr:type II toxin-antitoxin system HigB family toxin [Leptospiraceae bacterium]